VALVIGAAVLNLAAGAAGNLRTGARRLRMGLR
jgi:hypothetical protein